MFEVSVHRFLMMPLLITSLYRVLQTKCHSKSSRRRKRIQEAELSNFSLKSYFKQFYVLLRQKPFCLMWFVLKFCGEYIVVLSQNCNRSTIVGTQYDTELNEESRSFRQHYIQTINRKVRYDSVPAKQRNGG